ncbi:hypothetical protein GUITHDRAFT_154167, partial [Guillardia theta CCMP2712]
MLAERKLREEKKRQLCRYTSLQCLMSHDIAEGGSPDKKPLDAEDFRFHAVREVAYRQWQDKVPPKHGGMKKVFSELGSLSKVSLQRSGRGGGLTCWAGVARDAGGGGEGRKGRAAVDDPGGR